MMIMSSYCENNSISTVPQTPEHSSRWEKKTKPESHSLQSKPPISSHFVRNNPQQSVLALPPPPSSLLATDSKLRLCTTEPISPNQYLLSVYARNARRRCCSASSCSGVGSMAAFSLTGSSLDADAEASSWDNSTPASSASLPRSSWTASSETWTEVDWVMASW